MKNTISNNVEMWGEKHHWVKDGDEWSGQAESCNVPYQEWKQSVVDEFLAPAIRSDMNVLEIAPGHGRWSEQILYFCKNLILVDLNQSCIDVCKKKFSSWKSVEYIVTDGKSLPGILDSSVDFVWSYDSFVHMESDVILAYFREIQRVLKPSGRAVIHHAGRNHKTLWLGFLRQAGAIPRDLYRRLSMGSSSDNDGWRSNVSPELIANLAEQAGLQLESQVRFWGKNDRYGVPRFNDVISSLTRP